MSCKYLFTATVLVSSLAWAQDAAPKPQPPPPPIESHHVNADRSITFRYRAHGATSVVLQMDGFAKPPALVAGADGVWSFTTQPLSPQIYSYRFDVDGDPQFDPRNLNVTPNIFFNGAMVEVPGDTPQMWDVQPVSHGELHTHAYTTKVIRGLRADQETYMVYTPPGYDARSKKTYPVLYLLHGWSNTEATWTQTLQANVILDNLLAAGKMKPMIVVMPLGYGDMAFMEGWGVWQQAGRIESNTQLFQQALLTEILPRVEEQYRVSADRKDRAIAGLSMGGLESLSIGLSNTEKFAWVGGFSSAVHALKYPRPIPALDPKRANLKLLWIACGTEDGLIEANRKLEAALTAEGMPVTAIETGGAHVSMVWRDNLIHFAPLLFR